MSTLWSDDPIDDAQRFVLALGQTLAESELKIRTDPDHDRRAIDVVLACIHERLGLKATTERLFAFAQSEGMLVGEVPSFIAEELEIRFRRMRRE